MSTDVLLFTLFYVLVSVGIVYPPVEFISAGFTIPALFARYLCSENEYFIQYHIQRSALTLCVHSLLPFGYVFLMMLHYDYEQVSIKYILLVFRQIIICYPQRLTYYSYSQLQPSLHRLLPCTKFMFGSETNGKIIQLP